jgi:predicted DNA-binding transcriptional regulator AlpA
MDIDYDKLAKKVAENIYLMQSKDGLIWSPKECADYLKISERTFKDSTSKTYGFPAPIKLGTVGHPKFFASDVIDWAKSQKRAS